MSNTEERRTAADAGQKERSEEELDRRQVVFKLGAGLVTASVGIPVLMSVRSLVPNALYESPRRFKAGSLEQFSEGPTFIADQRVFIFREGKTFHCIGATCTHLGCTIQLVRIQSPDAPAQIEFHCPCHGSKFKGDGTNYAGPAPRPLDYFKLELAPDDGQLIVDMAQTADKGWRFTT